MRRAVVERMHGSGSLTRPVMTWGSRRGQGTVEDVPRSAATHSGPPKPRRPLSSEQCGALFSDGQRSRWPKGYAPTAAPGYFMRREGVTLKELIDAKADIRNDRRHELQRDLAMDYQLWCRSAFEEFAGRLTEEKAILLRRVTSRAALPSYADVVKLFQLPSLEPFAIQAESALLPGITMTAADYVSLAKRKAEEAALRAKIARGAEVTAGKTAPMVYPFTTYAAAQEFALIPLQGCLVTGDIVKLPDFPMVRNLLHCQFDSSSHMRFLAHRSGDELLLTREFVLELCQYLRSRWEQLASAEEKRRPIMTCFGNGRLAHFLNESGVLPVKVIAQREPTVATRRAAAQGPNERRAVDLPGPVKTPRSFFATFATEDVPLRAALAKHEPSIVVIEPHTERDYTAEARGYYTVREVVMLGRVDGNAMGSFTYPWLSFGVAPSAETYRIYNDRFQRTDLPDDSSFMPTDPPFMAQGYDKRYIDSISRWMIGSNDTPQLPFQYRCISHRRVEIPTKPIITPAADDRSSKR